MDYDLLFTVIKKEDWKAFTSSGKFEPDTIKEFGHIICIDEKNLEEYVNQKALAEYQLMLIIIDPLRVQDFIKSETKEGVRYIYIAGSLNLDAIIDKIDLNKNKKNRYKVSIKHYD